MSKGEYWGEKRRVLVRVSELRGGINLDEIR